MFLGIVPITIIIPQTETIIFLLITIEAVLTTTFLKLIQTIGTITIISMAITTIAAITIQETITIQGTTGTITTTGNRNNEGEKMRII